MSEWKGILYMEIVNSNGILYWKRIGVEGEREKIEVKGSSKV